MAELVRFLRAKDISGYDGVIVTHGTDSLPYTAAYLGYYFGRASVPMLLVSSNYALGEAGSNGQANFEAAVDFIREDRYAGVFVPFRNEEQEPVSIFLATRLLEADGFSDRFVSYDGGRLGRMEQGHFIFEEQDVSLPIDAFLKGTDSLQSEEIEDILSFPQVLKLRPYPGLSYDTIKINASIGAVFHGTYHSGTICMEGEAENAGIFVKNAAKQGIPFFFGPVKKQEKQYTSTQKVLLSGGLPVYDCSEIAAYVKLLIGCGLRKQGEELTEFMRNNIYFEQIEIRERSADS